MADRLEGVRPIKKALPTVKAAEGRKEMGTMQAASAQSKAFSDLKAGKTHTEVATALRQAATSVASREHDPQMVRPVEFSPSERSAMKRGDAKKLRELAAEIQAQGVAQRAAAKATKKAAPAKSTGDITKAQQDAEARRVAKALRAEAAPAPAAPKKRTAAEMRRAQALAGPDYPLEQVLADWDRQKEERKNLTGPVGEMIVRQMDDAMRRLQEAKTPAREDDALAGLLAPELRQLAQRLGLDSKGSKAALVQRIKDRVKGREAPTTSAERAVPKAEAPAAGVNESEPLKPFPHDDNMRMHADSPTMGLAFAYERAGRNGSANRMADLRYRATQQGGTMTPQQVVDELKTIRAQETDPKFQRMLDRAIDANDAPMTPIPDLPPDLPASLRKLMEDLHEIPYARKGPRSEAAIGVTSGPSLVDQLAEVFWDASRGERGPRRQHPQDRIRDIFRAKTHEMNEASFRIWEMTRRLESDEPMDVDTGRKVAELVKELRDWERSHWPKQ